MPLNACRYFFTVVSVTFVINNSFIYPTDLVYLNSLSIN
jgi:hypothetical protein